MKTKPTILTALAAAATLFASCGEKNEPANGAAKDSHPSSAAITGSDGLRVSGPYAHKNLAVYLIHGEGRAKDLKVVTLQEAMKNGSVVVHETGDVNQLTIENKSPDTHVFIHSGDIVKGGKQDRTLPNSIVLAPGSKPMPVASFCVEQSRWAKRGDEKLVAFSVSSKSLNTKNLKIAARKSKSQGKVWEQVKVSQDKMSGNIGKSVNAPASATSLQLALEDKDLEKLSKEYTDAISAQAKGTSDVVGYAFAIHGEFNSADIYLNNALFEKLWPKRLDAAASEAIAELDKKKENKHPDAETVASEIASGTDGKLSTEKLAQGNHIEVREKKEAIVFDAVYKAGKKAYRFHCNAISKKGVEEDKAPHIEQQRILPNDVPQIQRR